MRCSGSSIRKQISRFGQQSEPGFELTHATGAQSAIFRRNHRRSPDAVAPKLAVIDRAPDQGLTISRAAAAHPASAAINARTASNCSPISATPGDEGATQKGTA